MQARAPNGADLAKGPGMTGGFVLLEQLACIAANMLHFLPPQSATDELAPAVFIHRLAVRIKDAAVQHPMRRSTRPLCLG